MLRVILILALFLTSLVQVSCQTNDMKSILIIAIDKLAMSDVNCNQEPDSVVHSGFHILCKESVRFTHAYTTSTMSAPAMASILTGLYPYETKLRHNGGNLAAEFDLASELALRKNYHTSFYSGGAPIFRRSGLHQGFEIFEDNITPQLSTLFRPFKKTTAYFLQWLKIESANTPFFSVIYAPDLSYTTNQTTTNLGEIRNLSFESQIDELNEGLYILIKNLKAQKRWDDTTVILVGLNGHNIEERPGEFESTNLHGENTQVALLVKLAAQKKRDEAIYWKIDKPVSMVDIGRTLFDLLGETNLDKDTSDFPSHSLLGALKSPVVHWPEDRPLLIESGWPRWRNVGPIKMAAISNHILYLHNDKPLLFNTLLDRLEINPLPVLQDSILPITNKLQALLRKNQFSPYGTPNNEWQRKLSIPYARWMRFDQENLLLQDLKNLSNIIPESKDLANWTAQIALNQKDWKTLKELARKNKMATWQYVAEKNLNLKTVNPPDSCFAILASVQIDSLQLKKCDDSLFLEFIEWARAESLGLPKEVQRKKFERSYKQFLLDLYIDRTNIASDLTWDTNQENILAPSRTQLILNLPEFTKIRLQLNKSLIFNEDAS